MSEVTLKGGKVISIDVTEITVKEWRAFMNPGGSIADEDALIVKCTGLTAEEIEALKYRDLKEIVKAIVVAAQNPLADPN